MIKVSVQKNNVETNAATFPDQTSANLWISQCEAGLMWGKPARTLVADQNGNIVDVDGSIPNLSLATSTGTTTNLLGVTVNTYTFAADYTVTSTDVTAQVALQNSIQQGLARQNAGSLIVAQVYAFNEANLTANTLTPTQLQAMLADAGLAQVERCLFNGSLATALALIQASTTIPTYFSSTQITQIESAISAAITQIGS